MSDELQREYGHLPRTHLVLRKATTDVEILAAAARLNRPVRNLLVVDLRGHVWKIVDAMVSIIVSGAPEAADEQSVELVGRVERASL